MTIAKSNLTQLEEKYGLIEQPEPAATEEIKPEEHAPTLDYWRDSEPVVKLSAFIKEYRSHGFFVQQTRNGKPVLHFNPGLACKDTDPKRFELAEHAMFLMDEARDDLGGFIRNGVLSFPKNKEL